VFQCPVGEVVQKRLRDGRAITIFLSLHILPLGYSFRYEHILQLPVGGGWVILHMHEIFSTVHR
jgi:hypothetical protein